MLQRTWGVAVAIPAHWVVALSSLFPCCEHPVLFSSQWPAGASWGNPFVCKPAPHLPVLPQDSTNFQVNNTNIAEYSQKGRPESTSQTSAPLTCPHEILDLGPSTITYTAHPSKVQVTSSHHSRAGMCLSSEGGSLKILGRTFLPFLALLTVFQSAQSPSPLHDTRHGLTSSKESDKTSNERLAKQHHRKERLQLDFCLPSQSKAASCHCAKIHATFNTIQMTTGIKG